MLARHDAMLPPHNKREVADGRGGQPLGSSVVCLLRRFLKHFVDHRQRRCYSAFEVLDGSPDSADAGDSLMVGVSRSALNTPTMRSIITRTSELIAIEA
jgi:hypothetical protein